MAEAAYPSVDGAWADAATLGLLALPLLGFLVTGLWLGRKAPRVSAWTATTLMGGAAMLSLFLAAGYAESVLGAPDRFPGRAAVAWEVAWMPGTPSAGPAEGGNVTDTAVPAGPGVRLGILLDPISVMMAVLIAVLSFLVHLYSVGYMRGDAASGRFFPILSFFTFAMLGLVLSPNLVQTFVFWELVGAASYLLIGFWYTRPAAVKASQKAFLMTRFADAFFLMGVLLAGLHAGSFDFVVLNGPAGAAALDKTLSFGLVGVNLLTLATLLLYAGAWGKSAMFPLHGWLPDAMEGPTPVSSLLHSATMVVAGVYLTARLFPLFSAAAGTLDLVEWTGAFTAIFAAVIACAQTDLKRILAFSTLSQLGLMMAALGAGGAGGAGEAAFAASMFHVFTHAFFKCLLFLSAGVVIHAVHGGDLRDAGGLRKALPLTYGATLVAVLAIAGFPPFSGFFSKEEILAAAWAGGHPVAFGAGLVTGGLTAFYMTRYFLLVFHGKAPARAGAGHQAPHEEKLLVLPLLILAVPSAIAGWLAREGFLAVVTPGAEAGAAGVGAAGAHAAAQGSVAVTHGASWLPWAATGLALLGAVLGWLRYGGLGRAVRALPAPGAPAPAWLRLVERRFYIDDLYVLVAKGGGGRLLARPAAWVERTVLNGSFDLLASALRRGSDLLARLQNGQVQMAMGLALLGLYILFRSAGGFLP